MKGNDIGGKMKKTTKLTFGAISTLALTLIPNQASGAYVNYDVNIGLHENFNLSIKGFNAAAAGTVTDNNAMVGEITLSKTSGGAGLPNNYSSICVDLNGVLYVPSNYGFTAPVAFGNNTGWAPGWGYDGTTADAKAGIQHAADLFFTHAGSANTAEEWAALQLAVWEALYDTHVGSSASAYDVASGRFLASGDSATITLADTWLHSINMDALYSGSLLQPDPGAQHGATGQELLYNITPVPEPGTMIAGALLLLPLGASALRRLNKSHSS